MNPKIVLLLVVLIAFVCGAPQEKRGRYFEKAESGDYRYGYGTRNGDNVEQEATIKLGPVLEDGTQNMIPVVRGSYSFVDNFGKKHEVRYEADENGFRVLE
ncbi:larval cuticle protein 16/17 [Folsomia candida]|uniref:larval cuticle protein 16/17 n=1 Tax=Folsomia candida TaxID=158441 RepID=UPI000B9032D3|nr:larval cuticle protein 16/17 [Folsomia candida]